MTGPDTMDAAAAGQALQAGRLTLGDLAPGTARVAAAVVRPDETLLCLGYPGGRRVTVSVPCVPHDAGGQAWPATTRPLAVHLTARRANLVCSVLTTTPSGPARVRISLDEALTLCASGVHTVLSAG